MIRVVVIFPAARTGRLVGDETGIVGLRFPVVFHRRRLANFRIGIVGIMAGRMMIGIMLRLVIELIVRRRQESAAAAISAIGFPD